MRRQSFENPLASGYKALGCEEIRLCCSCGPKKNLLLSRHLHVNEMGNIFKGKKKTKNRKQPCLANKATGTNGLRSSLLQP